MANKSNRKEHPLISNFASPIAEFSCALMLLREVSIFQMSTGLYNLIHQMTLKITSTESEELLEEHKVLAKLFFSYMNMKSGS